MIVKIKLDDKNVEFLEKIEEISGETVTLCEQCGTCSGSCPVVIEMDLTPSQMMRKVQLGQEDVMDTQVMWMCATCFTCTVRCPRNIDIAKVAEALRQVKLRQAVDKIDITTLSEEEVAKLPSIAVVGAFRKFTG